MNLLQIFFIISAIIIAIVTFDIAKKQKFNALHFLVFFGISGALFLFTIFPNSLNVLGSFFGLQRGADLLVYSSIIFLFYFVLLLLNKVENNRSDLTKLVRELAIESSTKKNLEGKYVFVIPAYNEEKIIYKIVSEILEAGYQNIIVVNDGSTDNTLAELKKMQDKIIVLNHFKNRGQGRALETGFEYVRRYGNVEYVVTFDSDGQHNLEDISNFEKAMKENKNALVFLGSRFKGKTENITLLRKIVLKLGILFTFFISSIKLSDTHNGYRVIKKEALKDIKITLDGMGHASELIDIIANKKIPFVEVPVNIKYTDYSISKGQKSGNAINIALKIIWNKFFK